MAFEMSDGTRAAMLTFGQRLASDVASIRAREAGGLDDDEVDFLQRARAVLDALDALDVGLDERADREVERLRMAPGEEWLMLAEGGDPALRSYVAHVLTHCGRPEGVRGSLFVTRLLQTIDAADEAGLDALAVAYPEYVGLWRAASGIRGGLDRLAAIRWRE